mmetsp:Transcript_33877/g.34514  ORF Transcript_33877/g.34514 Transcript_33877/m.34514 type:complete len:82 (+) Transcript_33877:112-357(+)
MGYKVYAVVIVGSGTILGIFSLVRIYNEWRRQVEEEKKALSQRRNRRWEMLKLSAIALCASGAIVVGIKIRNFGKGLLSKN